ncbi:MAG TPA: AI-2E family transporter [Vicinamibacterales bacterium]|nr:AI-2E family transporter [Vicinamibacterales bacterium]
MQAAHVIAAVLVIYFLQWAQELLIPIVLAALISFILAPFVRLMRRLWIPRVVAAALAIVMLAAVIGVGVWAVSDDAIQVVEGLPAAARQLRGRLRTAGPAEQGPLEKVQRAATELERTAAAAAPPERALGGVQRVEVVEPAFRARDYLWWGGMGLVGFAGQLVMILFLSYFLLASGDLYKRKFVRLAGPRLAHRRITTQIIDDVSEQVGRFLLTLLGTSLIVAAATGFALWWYGLESWLFWGIASGVLNTIPYFGPIIVSAALAVVSLLQFGTLTAVASVFGIAFTITAIEGWLLTPTLMGRAASMNPVAVFIGLLFWGWVWGLWGVVLAVPLMMLVNAFCQRVEDLQWVCELLGE